MYSSHFRISHLSFFIYFCIFICLFINLFTSWFCWVILSLRVAGSPSPVAFPGASVLQGWLCFWLALDFVFVFVVFVMIAITDYCYYYCYCYDYCYYYTIILLYTITFLQKCVCCPSLHILPAAPVIHTIFCCKLLKRKLPLLYFLRKLHRLKFS